MKKGFIKILTAGLVLSASAGLVGCTTTESNNDEIKYSFYNYDNTYDVYEVFSLEGAKLKLTKPDGSTEEITITDSMIKQMPDMSTAGTKTIVIVYDDVEYELTIEVVAIEEGVTVLNSSFSGFKNEYELNETFDISNLKLNVSLSNGSNPQIPITVNMIVSMPNMSTVGTKTVVVSYNGQQYSFSFEVKDSANGMLTKLQNFMKDYNSASVKDSSIKINVEGLAKYLQDNVEFNEELMNIQMSSILDIEGYQIGKIGETYVFVKSFDNIEDLYKEWDTIHLFNTDYVVMLQCESANNYVTEYGTTNMANIAHRVGAGEELVEITLDEFKNSISLTEIYSEDDKYITVFNSVFAQPIYKAITNAIVNSTMNIQKGDIISAKDNLTAKLDIVKILNNISTNIANVDFYDMFVNDMLLTESDTVYVDLARTYIAELFEIADQNTLDELDYVLTKDIKKIRNNQLGDLETTYNMIVELNDIIQASDGNSSLLEKLNIIVSGIDSQDKHMLSKFIYSCKDFVTIEKRIYGESEDYDYIHYTLNGIVYDAGYIDDTYIYRYYYDQEVDEPEMIETYYAGLKSLIEKFENIKDYTSIKTFANDIIADLRTMDAVNQEMEENEYISAFLNIGVTSSVRMAVEYYIEMYDAEMIADIIDMLALTQPENSEIYEILSESMYGEFCAGDKVLVQPASTYNVGDIIAYNSGNTVVVHRIIEITEQEGVKYYTCKGDNNSLADSPITEDKIIGAVTAVNPIYIGLDENLITALRDCSDIIYSAFKPSGNIDYVKLIEDLCERLEVEKDYYIQQYNEGKLTIFADLFERFVPDWNEGEGAELEFNTAVRNACLYLDSIFVEGTDRTEFINEINKCVKALYNLYDEQGEGYEQEKMLTDCIVKMTNTEQDFYVNLQDVVTEYKSTAKEYIKMILTSVLSLDAENETAMNDLDHIINYHLTAYIKDELNMSDVIGDINNYIDKYCDEETKVYAKTSAILGVILMGEQENIDYNELFAGIELPNEIQEVDFNKLINETLKDKNTYDILSLNDVKVDYITDAQGNIIKEVLTVSLKANYDILLSSLDANVTLTIEINF